VLVVGRAEEIPGTIIFGVNGDKPVVTYWLRRLPVANSATILALADRSFSSIAADFEQVMPRGRSFATRGIIGEVWKR